MFPLHSSRAGGAAGGIGVGRMSTASCRVVRTFGELDLCSAARFRAELASGLARAGNPPRLVVDLTGVTFLDCSALRELCAAWRRVASDDGWLRLVYTEPRTHRVLRAARLTDVFPRYDTVAEAAADG
jgi:anti-sigma B factor antagonist